MAAILYRTAFARLCVRARRLVQDDNAKSFVRDGLNLLTAPARRETLLFLCDTTVERCGGIK